MNNRIQRVWKCRAKRLLCGKRTLVMGILNVTPDSFSDGGRYFNHAAAVERGIEICSNGADILDVGGQSTRPGAAPVTEAEEIRRTAPVIRDLAKEVDALISIDTMNSGTAHAALEAGAHIVNDVSAGENDPAMASMIADYEAGAVAMHMRGTPSTMQKDPHYEDVVSEVAGYLGDRLQAFLSANIAKEQIVLDPGIGFGKTVEHNLELLRHIDELSRLKRPVLIGASNKSFIGKLLDLPVGERESGSLGAAAYSILRGADILRVHAVKKTCQVARLIDILQLRP